MTTPIRTPDLNIEIACVLNTVRPTEFPDNRARMDYLKRWLQDAIAQGDWTMVATIAIVIQEIEE